MTQLSYGTYNHDDDEVGLRIHYRSIFDKFHRRMGDIQTWHVVGIKQASSVANLTTALGALETAYSSDYGDLTFFDNDSNPTRHRVVSSNTFSGVQVAHFSYPQGAWSMNNEYSKFRSYQIVLTAEVRVGPANAVYAYREKIRQIGTGGPLRRYMGSLTGTPVLQTLRLQTPIRYVQEGYVIGRGMPLAAPSPLPLGNEMLEQRIIGTESAMDIRVNGAELYMTPYRYVFEGVSATTPLPNSYTINPF